MDISLEENAEKGLLQKLICWNTEIGFIEYSPKVFRNILMLDSINHDELLR
jgi:hypothetical protein